QTLSVVDQYTEAFCNVCVGLSAVFFCSETALCQFSSLSLHDALPISRSAYASVVRLPVSALAVLRPRRHFRRPDGVIANCRRGQIGSGDVLTPLTDQGRLPSCSSQKKNGKRPPRELHQPSHNTRPLLN